MTPPPESDDSLVSKINDITNNINYTEFFSLNDYKKALVSIDKDAQKIRTLASRIKNTTTQRIYLRASYIIIYDMYRVKVGEIFSMSKLSTYGFGLGDMKDFYKKALNLNKKIQSFDKTDIELIQDLKLEEQQINNFLIKVNAS